MKIIINNYLRSVRPEVNAALDLLLKYYDPDVDHIEIILEVKDV